MLFLSRNWVPDNSLNIADISQDTAFRVSIQVLALDAKILRGSGPPTWRLLNGLVTGALPNLRNIVLLQAAADDCAFEGIIGNVLWLDRVLSSTQLADVRDHLKPHREWSKKTFVMTLDCREGIPPGSEPSVSQMKRILLEYLE